MGVGAAWTCSCGRRVPGSVSACRCGTERPKEESAAGAADFIEQRSRSTSAAPASEASPATEGGIYRGYVQIAVVILVFAVFFGSRAFNKWRTSSEARAQIVEALSERLGADEARLLADEHHGPCFESSYQTGWGRRRASQFDEEKYAECVLKGLMRNASSTTRRSAPARPAPAAVTTTPAAPAPAPAQALAPATISDLRIVTFFRATGVIEAQFAASGPSLESLSCEYHVRCASGDGHRGTAACLTETTSTSARGSLTVLLGVPPGDGVCSLSTRLTDSAGPRGEWAQATLVETAQ